MRVVFFGTPDFAVPSLLALVGEGFDVVAAVTQPDKPQGRSRSTLVPPPVKVAAQGEDVPVLQPARPTGAEFYRTITDLAPDIGVVVAYGHILKPDLLSIPVRGMVNVHPSLLPELRGAAPVEWAVLSGLEKTGVTIMQMTAGLDSGPILHQIPHRIPNDVTGGELSEQLAEMGAQALVEALELLEANMLKPVPQKDADATYAPKLTREVDPRPGAWAELDGRQIKLFGAQSADGTGHAGEVLTADGRLLIAVKGGAVEVQQVQPAGKPRMPTADWVRGRGVAAGQRFT